MNVCSQSKPSRTGEGSRWLSKFERGVPPVAFHTLSWRSQYPDTNQNRRFYWEKGGACWALRVSVARQVLEQAEQAGMLNPAYDDKYERFGGGAPTYIESSEMESVTRAALWSEITVAAREPAWGKDPEFIVAMEYGGRWRKIMILNPEPQLVTFRSCTTNSEYRPVVVIPNSPVWRMDNAMQDVSTGIARWFLTYLRR